MLVVLEAAGMLVNRVSSEWHLAPGGSQVYFSDFRPVRRPSGLGSSIAKRFSHLVAWFRQTRERRELIRELSAKDDRLLADIGISREQIHEVADAAVKQGPKHATQLASPKARVHYEAAAVDQVANDNETRIAA